jgi:hypothetical protein
MKGVMVYRCTECLLGNSVDEVGDRGHKFGDIRHLPFWRQRELECQNLLLDWSWALVCEVHRDKMLGTKFLEGLVAQKLQAKRKRRRLTRRRSQTGIARRNLSFCRSTW